MWKYWVIMLVILGALLVYSYFADPCIGLVRSEFVEKHPGAKIVSTDAEAGSPESVRCVVSYRKPGNQEIHKEVWWYKNPGSGWALHKIVEPSDAPTDPARPAQSSPGERSAEPPARPGEQGA